MTARLPLLFLAAASTVAGVTPAEWHADLRYFQRELERRHKNAFHFTAREPFEAAVADLDRRLDSLDRDAIYVGLARLAAMIGDAHTNIAIPPETGGAYPVRLRRFGDDYRVVQAAAGLERALGSRLIRIQETPIDRAVSMLFPLFAQDEHPWFHRAVVQNALVAGWMLHGLGIAAEHADCPFTFLDDGGSEFTLPLHTQTLDQQRTVTWVLAVKETELSRQSEPMRRPAENLQYTYIPAGRAVYANVRTMRSLGKPGAELMAFVKQKQADKLIIDLRQNPGGNYFEGLHHLIGPLQKMPAINRKGHLFVLIGPLTGSAALVDASLFHTKTEALLVGEPIGAKPREYSERRQMQLPKSHVTVNYSVRFYDFSYNAENVVRPDQEIVPTWEQFKAGMNPVIDWCVNYSAATSSATPQTSRSADRTPDRRL